MKNKILGTGGLIIAVIALLAVNIVGPKMFKSTRLDLTEGRLYTLSEGTLEVLRNLDEPVTLRFYLSRKLATGLPGIKSYADRVDDLLEQFRRESDGKINLVRIDPEPFSDEEDRAVAYGMRGIPVDENDNTLYFGLVGTGSTGQEDAIPFFSLNREKFLEYDVSRLIYALKSTAPPTVGLIAGLPLNGPTPQQMMAGMNQPAWAVMDQIKQLFTVVPLEMQAREIPDEMDVLMVVHPKLVPKQLMYAIDQFALRGGRVLMFVDALAEADLPQGRMAMMQRQLGKTSNPEALLEGWGVRMVKDKVVGDLASAMRVQTQRNQRLITIDYPLWMNLGRDRLNDTDIVTANLENIALGSPGALEAVEGATTTIEPLLRTSEQAMLMDKALADGPADPEGLLRDYKPGGEERLLAVRITGKARSAYPDGPPEEEKTEGAGSPAARTHPHLTESSSDINVILVSDADMLHDRFWVRVQDLLGSRIAVPTAGNGSFVVNALDNLTGSSSLIAVRSRGSFIRPFTRIDSLRQEAELAFREKEAELIARLQQTEQRLQALESEKQGEDSLVLSDAQARELVEFRRQRLAIRKELREVRRSLRRNIEELHAKVRFANIGLVPLLIAIGGVLVALVRYQRRRASIREVSA
jgi:ABC-type uncharacterized transport system involved in gliding motility auxiliary subunit